MGMMANNKGTNMTWPLLPRRSNTPDVVDRIGDETEGDSGDNDPPPDIGGFPGGPSGPPFGGGRTSTN